MTDSDTDIPAIQYRILKRDGSGDIVEITTDQQKAVNARQCGFPVVPVITIEGIERVDPEADR